MGGDLRQFPWAVSVYDLLAMAEIIKEPFVFPHYLKTRLRLSAAASATALDELDYLAHYFGWGLKPRRFDGAHGPSEG